MLSGAVDSYSLTARIAPSLILLAPAALTVTGLYPTLLSGAPLIASVSLAFALLLLISQFVRDAGKRTEQRLLAMWGGFPTVLMLRHDGPNGVRDVTVLHRRIENIAAFTLPSIDDEHANLASADSRYASAVVVLRERTRSRDDFPTVASANATYGFRRNMRGSKSAGLWISGTSAAVGLGVMLNRHNYFTNASPVALGIALAASTILLVSWLWLFNDVWVRVAADDYAVQLLNATANLAG